MKSSLSKLIICMYLMNNFNIDFTPKLLNLISLRGLKICKNSATQMYARKQFLNHFFHYTIKFHYIKNSKIYKLNSR